MAKQECPAEKYGFATTAIHTESDEFGAIVLPIVTASTFKIPDPDVKDRTFYGRCGNPTRDALERCLAALDNGKHGFAFASGHGAMMTIFAMLSKGDHLLSCDDIYSGTNNLLKEVVMRMGIEVTFTDFTNIENVEKAIQENTKMVWLETPTNPTLKVVDIAAVCKLVKSRGDIIIGVDNTFLTSYFQKPLDLGVDIAKYSVTKFINGHADVVMGAAVVRDDELAMKLRNLQMLVGAVPSPIDCYLITRSMKTMALRMEKHKESALLIAKWLQKQECVAEVFHPGLPDHPQYDIAKRQTTGHSGIFSFRHIGGLEESKIFLRSLKLFILAVSFGGSESLIELPSTMTHSTLPEAQRQKFGITDSLIRISVGLEDTEDLIRDLDQALKIAFS